MDNFSVETSTCVTLISGLEAARILNNLTDQRVNLSAIVTLHCDADGRPSPTVLWTKNNQTVVEGSGLLTLLCCWVPARACWGCHQPSLFCLQASF